MKPYFYLAFDFDCDTGEPVIYIPRDSDDEVNNAQLNVYEHLIRCIKEYDYILAIPTFNESKDIFGDMYYMKEGDI